MGDFVVVFILVAVVGAASLYLYRAKKRGVKCVGCPSCSCGEKKTNGCSACGCHRPKE